MALGANGTQFRKVSGRQREEGSWKRRPGGGEKILNFLNLHFSGGYYILFRNYSPCLERGNTIILYLQIGAAWRTSYEGKPGENFK